MTRPAVPALAVMGLLTGCSGGEPTPPPEPEVRPARVEVFAAESTLLVGNSMQLQVAAWDSAGRPLTGVKVGWRSLDPQQLSVDTSGLVHLASDAPRRQYRVSATAYVGYATDTLALSVAFHGEVKWRVPIASAGYSGGPALSPDGTIYVLGQHGYNVVTLFAVSPRGSVKWTRRLEQADGTNYPVVGSDGSVYVVGQYVYALAPDGTLRWSLTTRPVEVYPPIPEFHSGALSSNGILYAAMGYDLFAFRASNGDTVWTGPRAPDAGWLLPPTISVDGRTAYIKNTGTRTYAFDAGTGAVRWTVPDPDAWGTPSYGVGPTLFGSRLLVPGDDIIQELDTVGHELGHGGEAYGMGDSEPVVGPDGTFYVQYPQRVGLRAFHEVSTPLWEQTGFGVRWTWYGAPALAQGSILYTAAIDGFYALQLGPSGATVRWRYPVQRSDSLAFVGAPLIGSDGTVYTFSSCAGTPDMPCSDELFAFWEDKPVEPNSPWPMWRHDPQRTGQAGPQPH